ncbi:MAG: hypothetical protein M1136_11590 [Chloroflexi bacterium]|nr:hypothetical protein [Chloroflexota bacterium]
MSGVVEAGIHQPTFYKAIVRIWPDLISGRNPPRWPTCLMALDHGQNVQEVFERWRLEIAYDRVGYCPDPI